VAQDDAMGDLVNLRRVKKARQKQAASEAAEVRRLQFGRTLAERERDRQAERRAKAVLDQARLEPDPSISC
jgi:hypothetical protein